MHTGYYDDWTWCPECAGSGLDDRGNACPECDGEGGWDPE